MTVSRDDPIHDLPDRAIRQSLIHPQHLQALLEETVPLLAPNFDCTRTRLLDREFPLNDWRRREADLPFEIPYRLGDKEVFALVFVLVEHQSTLDQWIPLRTLIYVTMYYERIWKRWEEAPAPKPAVKLPPALPIALYTGPRRWGSNETLADLLAEPRALHPFCPTWQPLFWNLADRTPEQLLASASEWLQTLAVIRAEDADAEDFRRVYNEAVQKLGALAEREPVRIYDLLRIVLTWALWRRPVPEHPPLVRTAEEANTHTAWRKEVDRMKGMGDTLLDRGRAEGRLLNARETLLELLTDRFGPVPDELRRRIESCTDLEQLRTAARQSWRVSSPEEISLPEPPPTPTRESPAG